MNRASAAGVLRPTLFIFATTLLFWVVPEAARRMIANIEQTDRSSRPILCPNYPLFEAHRIDASAAGRFAPE
jgi:hypothetical protein